MSITKQSVFSFNSVQKEIREISAPTECPMCKRAIFPIFVSLIIESTDRGSITYFCPGCSCSFVSRFIYSYYRTSGSPQKTINTFKEYTKHEPMNFVKHLFPEEIKTLSSRFVEIYNQSLQAENLGLSELAGMGYRKSLEVLVKDYIIRMNPESADLIKSPKYTLKKCIDSYIHDPRIKNSSLAAAFIGNDETHYTRMHENKDVQNLKKYISVIVTYIQLELIAHEASVFVGS